MQAFLSAVSSVVWGIPMLLFFSVTAIRFTFKSGFFQFRGFGKMLKTTLGSLLSKKSNEGISQWGAFCSVLGACIGTGNIVGVATAIYSGGPGTVFWMWLWAWLSMMTAYSENYLGIKYKRINKYGVAEGGAFSYIENGVGIKGLSRVYAVFCLGSALGMGNLAQGNSVSESLSNGFGINKALTGLIAAFLCFLVIRGGAKTIASFGKITVPAMVALYLGLSLAVLFINRAEIPGCINIIFREAFSLKALSGFGIFEAIRFGISRGVFSNEAGLGSSTILHSQVETDDGKTQGMWAMLEVFTDTVFLCTITALVILTASAKDITVLYGAELSIAAYGAIGEIGKKGISLLTAVFAFTSLASCSFYGEKSFEHLFGKTYKKIYRVGYILLVFAGCISAPKLVWTLADICNGLMAVPNLFSINTLSKEIEYP